MDLPNIHDNLRDPADVLSDEGELGFITYYTAVVDGLARLSLAITATVLSGRHFAYKDEFVDRLLEVEDRTDAWVDRAYEEMPEWFYEPARCINKLLYKTYEKETLK